MLPSIHNNFRNPKLSIIINYYNR